MTREKLVAGLVIIGENLMSGEDEAEIDAYLAPDFTFHGPDGGEWDYRGSRATSRRFEPPSPT